MTDCGRQLQRQRPRLPWLRDVIVIIVHSPVILWCECVFNRRWFIVLRCSAALHLMTQPNKESKTHLYTRKTAACTWCWSEHQHALYAYLLSPFTLPPVSIHSIFHFLCTAQTITLPCRQQ